MEDKFGIILYDNKLCNLDTMHYEQLINLKRSIYGNKSILERKLKIISNL